MVCPSLHAPVDGVIAHARGQVSLVWFEDWAPGLHISTRRGTRTWPKHSTLRPLTDHDADARSVQAALLTDASISAPVGYLVVVADDVSTFLALAVGGRIVTRSRYDAMLRTMPRDHDLEAATLGVLGEAPTTLVAESFPRAR